MEDNNAQRSGQLQRIETKKEHKEQKIHFLRDIIIVNDILHPVVVYEVLIKLGSDDIYLINGRISAGAWLFWESIFSGIILKRVG